MGTVVAFGIGILNATTPSTYLAVPITLSASLVEIGNSILLSIRMGLCLYIKGLMVFSFVVPFLVALIDNIFPSIIQIPISSSVKPGGQFQQPSYLHLRTCL